MLQDSLSPCRSSLIPFVWHAVSFWSSQSHLLLLSNHINSSEGILWCSNHNNSSEDPSVWVKPTCPWKCCSLLCMDNFYPCSKTYLKYKLLAQVFQNSRTIQKCCHCGSHIGNIMLVICYHKCKFEPDIIDSTYNLLNLVYWELYAYQLI